jgi:putative ABC transport system substrate-binding protein
LRALRQKLGELGYVEGRDIVFEIRAANEDFERLPELAADLVRANVDVIVAVSPPAIRAVEIATTTILIVMAFSGTDPGASVSGATLDLLASPLAAGAQQTFSGSCQAICF